MFKFVSDHVGGVGTKRKQAPKTCEACRKRHKRCAHHDQSADFPVLRESPAERSPTDLPEAARHADSPVGSSSTPNAPGTGVSTRSRQGSEMRSLSKEAYLRFVGDLSPEASFLSNQRRGPHGTTQTSRHEQVGVWLGQRHGADDGAERPNENGDAAVPAIYDRAIQSFGLAGLQALTGHLREECLSVLPHPHDLGVIISLYYAKIDPIFPIVRAESLEMHRTSESVALKQCICLVAALDPKLRQYLRLPHTARLLSPIEFRNCLSAAVKQSLDMGFIHDRVVLLQVCALMSFTADETKFSEVSAAYVSQAVHHTQTLGLHLGWPDDGPESERPKRLFWCIWVLDRLNASANGRPILIHQQDMDMRIFDTAAEQDPPFRLLIRISRFLDTVISRYRPHSSNGSGVAVDEDVSFEDLVRDAKATEISSSVLASLEMFYLAVIVLKVRPKAIVEQGQPSPSSDLQMLSAASIISIASEEFRHSISFWPVVSYAVSLAASVAYKTLRNSIMAHRRKRAYVLFQTSCDVLDELGRSFSSARAIARLATDTVQEVERVAADRSRTRRSQRTNLVDSGPESNETRSDRASRGPETTSLVQAESRETPPQAGQTNLGSNTAYQGTDSIDSTLLHLESPGIFDDWVGGAGIFNDFDPNFDLDRIDQVFSANLDPMQPLSLQDWSG